MTKQFERGTRDWFRSLRRDILDGARAFQSISMSVENAALLVSNWDTLTPTLNSALLTATVVNYSRPFVEVRGPRGRPYSLRRIARALGFGLTTHRHLLQIRHKMVAHADQDFLDARLGSKVAIIRKDDGDSAHLLVELEAVTTALWQVQERETASEFLAHVRSAAAGVSDCVHKDLLEYMAASRDHPAQCPSFERSAEQSLASTPFRLEPNASVYLPLPSFDPASLKAPPLTEKRGAYLYQLLSVKAQSASADTEFSDGSKVTASVAPREAPQG